MVLVQRAHAIFGGDLGGETGADGAVGVAHGIGELHLLAPLEHRPGIVDHLGVETVRDLVARRVDMEAALAVPGIDLGEDRVEVEIVEMFGPAADLAQQFGATDNLAERAIAEPRQNLAHFLGHIGHQIDHLFRRAGEFLAQLFVLDADPDRAGVAVALADHDAAHRHQAERPDAEFLGPQDRSDDDVAAGLEAAVGAQFDPVAQAVEGEHLIGFGQAHFPRRAGELDRGLRRGTGAAGVAGDQDDIGMGLGDTGGDRADPRRRD